MQNLVQVLQLLLLLPVLEVPEKQAEVRALRAEQLHVASERLLKAY